MKDKAKKEATEAERMFKNAELFIQRGMRLKNSDIESGRAVLAQAQQKWTGVFSTVMLRKRGRKLGAVSHSLFTSLFLSFFMLW